jgi:hypothetical protein
MTHALPILGIVAVKATVAAVVGIWKYFRRSENVPKQDAADPGSASFNESSTAKPSGIPRFTRGLIGAFARCIANFKEAMYDGVALLLRMELLPCGSVKIPEGSSLSLLVTKNPCFTRAP